MRGRRGDESALQAWVLQDPHPRFLAGCRQLGRAAFGLLFRMEVHGQEWIPRRGACIVAANHPSYLDPLMVGWAVPRPVRTMTWDQVFRLGPLGWAARLLGAFPVGSTPKGIARAMWCAGEILRRDRVLVVFPEGGRSPASGRMGPVRPGLGQLAVTTGAPIVPATVLGTSLVWPRTRFFFRPGKVHVIFHPPVRLDAAERAGRERDRAFHQAITERVARTISEPISALLALPRRRALRHLRPRGWSRSH